MIFCSALKALRTLLFRREFDRHVEVFERLSVIYAAEYLENHTEDPHLCKYSILSELHRSRSEYRV